MRALMLLAVLTACAEAEPDLDDLVTDAGADGRDVIEGGPGNNRLTFGAR